MRRRILQTLIFSVAITIAALTLDYLVNVVLFPGEAHYTPLSTMAISMIVAPCFTYFILMQNDKMRAAQAALTHEQAARIAAESVNAARSRFLANASHELRTPLNAIIGYSELMLETAEADGREGDVVDHARVISAGRRLVQLVNDLLDLAKVEAGEMRIRCAAYSVPDLLADALESVRPLAEANGNTLSLRTDEALKDGHSDAFRLSQCLLNLLTNAAKHTSNGAVSVHAVLDRAPERDWLVIAVKDTGAGIASDQLASLFEPFMQARTTVDGGVGAAGVGLAITRRLADLLGGSLSAESERGKGSCFTLRVPLRHSAAPANDAGRPALTLVA